MFRCVCRDGALPAWRPLGVGVLLRGSNAHISHGFKMPPAEQIARLPANNALFFVPARDISSGAIFSISFEVAFIPLVASPFGIGLYSGEVDSGGGTGLCSTVKNNSAPHITPHAPEMNAVVRHPEQVGDYWNFGGEENKRSRRISGYTCEEIHLLLLRAVMRVLPVTRTDAVVGSTTKQAQKLRGKKLATNEQSRKLK